MTSVDFMEAVQLHERKWGDNQYPGRPTLAQIMKSLIVVMWRIDKRFILSTHQSGDEANALVLQVLTGQLPDNRKLEQIFVNRQAIKFGIRIVSEQEAQEPSTESKPRKTKPHTIKADDVVFIPASIIRDNGKPQTIKRGDVVISEVQQGDLLPGRNIPFQQQTKKRIKK